MAALSPPCHSTCREKGLSCVCPQLQLIPPHHCSDHSQIQPRSLALVVLGGQGALAALGVRWAREGQLSLLLLGVLLVLFLLCCPAKGTRRGQLEGGSGCCLEPASRRQSIFSRMPSGTGHGCSP